ncbi:MAG: gamma carbonic anhydrase family protein [Woeseiaceae bacterium]|nr:gamma carbonic anhydrase family protein [Woeseiaceae bacterium]
MIYALGDRSPELVGDGHFVAPNASVIGHVRLLPESSVWFNCVLRGDNEPIEVGAGSNVQDGCVLHTDPGFPLTIATGVTVGHKVMLHGCTIGENSLIGIGSTILNGATIGRNCLVGAHSLVTEGKSFPDGSLIIGAPAKVLRELTEEEIAGMREAARHYIANAARFSSTLTDA